MLVFFFIYIHTVIRHDICRRMTTDAKQWVFQFYIFPVILFKKKIFDFLKCTLNAKKTNDINRKFYFISRGLDDRGHF